MPRKPAAAPMPYVATPDDADEVLGLSQFERGRHLQLQQRQTYRSHLPPSADVSTAVDVVVANRHPTLKFAKRAKADHGATLASQLTDLLAKEAEARASQTH